jgi:anti-anti-sigma factor
MAIIESTRALVVRDLGGREAMSEGDPLVVWLRGEHDLSTVREVSDVLSRAISDEDRDVVVDLSGVEFMGAATIGVLVRARQDLRSRARSLTLRAPSTSADRVLRACRIDLVESG